MKQIRILLLAVLFATAHSGQEAASGGVPADIVYGQPGQLVSVDGFRLNVYRMGSGSPTWSTVQPQIAKWTSGYDRAGAGFVTVSIGV
jgi:hypothetical protein